MSLAPLTIIDTFSRSVTDGWGNTDSGEAWLGESSIHDVVVNEATITLAANAAYGTTYIDLDANGIANQSTCEVLTLVRWEGSSTSITTDFGPAICRTASNTFYAVSLDNISNEVAIIVYAAGSRIELGRAAVSGGLEKNQWYWVRFQRISGAIKVKVWTRSTAEPISWTKEVSPYSGANAPGSGDPGFFWKGTSVAHTIRLSNYYFYTNEDAETDFPISDTFTRTVANGWGRSSSGHVWEGHVSDNPDGYSNDQNGSVDGAFGLLTITDTTERQAFLGQSVTGNVETLAKFGIQNEGEGQYIHVGLFGTMTQVSGGTFGHGYVVDVALGQNVIRIYKKTTYNGTWTLLIASAALGFTFTAGTDYWVRFKIEGTTLSARAWVHGTSEPSTWSAVAADSSITSGRMFFQFGQTSAVSTNFHLDDISYATPAPALTTHTTTGSLTSTAQTDTTLAMSAAFTNDSDADNSITVQYKKASENTYTTFGGTKTRGASAYTFTLTGLERNTSYNVRVTFADPDTVVGSNPRNLTVSTTNNGVTAGALSTSNVTATSVDVKATYTGDTDNDSSATLEYRVSSYETQVVNDSFSSGTGVLLQNRTPEIGGAWIKHPIATAGSAGDLSIVQTRVRMNTNAGATAQYYNDAIVAQAEYEVHCDLVVPSNGPEGIIGIAARMDTTADTYYTFQYNSDATEWRIRKSVAGVRTTLATLIATLDPNTIYRMTFVVKDAYKAALVDGIEILRTTDNAVTAAGKAGIRGAYDQAQTTDHLTLDNFLVTYRVNSGSWTSAGAMTADRTNKWFTKTQGSLTSDAVYEFRVTWADADGLYGSSPQSITAQTLGQAVWITSIGASAQPTSAIVDVFYTYDTNNNSSLSVQYRSTMELLWTTVPTTNVTVDRVAKKFSTTLIGLRANTTYEVKATVADPNGIIEGTPSSLVTLFTTLGFEQPSEKYGKHYLWKSYDPVGTYVTTWADAGEPEFAWHQNGGVSDLAVSLPRKISTVQDYRMGIAHQNRIDVWCLDPSSDGFGPNLVPDPEFELGAWTLGSNASVHNAGSNAARAATGGPDGGKALYIREMTEPIETFTTRSGAILLFRQPVVGGGDIVYPVPYVVKCVARALGSKLVMYAEAYDINDNKIDQSDELAETVGSDWQNLRIEYTPPSKASYIRVAVENDARGEMFVDKVSVRTKELLIYRGRIESFTPRIDSSGERVDIQILGLVSLLSDDYVEFLQYVNVQPQKDSVAGRPFGPPTDPAEILKDLINIGRNQNPFFDLYYTDTSIQATGTVVQYTFRDQQLRAAFDKVRALCPPGWHYYVEPDGLVVLRGPEHAFTHVLRLGVEITDFSVEKSIRNLKNFVHVKGRQDEDESEPDGFGSIHYVAFNQASIDTYGKRMLFIRDSNITDPETAEIIGNGRLDELDREEQRAECTIPDEKSINYVGGALRGYNIEAFRPGDNIVILDPVAGPRNVYWDQLVWDQDTWDFSNVFLPLPDSAPVVTVEFHGASAKLNLSERQPSAVSDFGRLANWINQQDSESGE